MSAVWLILAAALMAALFLFANRYFLQAKHFHVSGPILISFLPQCGHLVGFMVASFCLAGCLRCVGFFLRGWDFLAVAWLLAWFWLFDVLIVFCFYLFLNWNFNFVNNSHMVWLMNYCCDYFYVWIFFKKFIHISMKTSVIIYVDAFQFFFILFVFIHFYLFLINIIRDSFHLGETRNI